MNLPLDFLDLNLFLAIMSIILLVTAELLTLYHGKISIVLSRKRLTQAAVICGALFLIAFALRIIGIFMEN